MASVAIVAGGAILNAVAFIGSNYLARVLSGDSSKAPFEGKKKDMTNLSRATKPLTPNMKKNELSCSTGSKPATKSKSRPSRISQTPATLLN